MSDLAPIGRPNPTELTPGIAGSFTDRAAATATPTERGQDRVELSSTAQLLSKMSDLPDVRQDVIDRVRTEIDLGIYETDDKIEASIDALADDLL